MGTSQSSNGPGPGVPMLPPWVEDPPAGSPPGDAPPPADGGDEDPPTPAPSPVAPVRRWTNTRSNLGDFARTGSNDAMRRALRNYVRNGYGGSATATRRMGGTATTAGSLATALNSLTGAPGTQPFAQLDRTLLASRSVDEILDAVVEAVRPVDGTQDSEASRAAIRDALSEVLRRFPDADMLDLSAEQREFAIERFTANDVFRRFELDTGQTIIEAATTTSMGLARLKEIREYVRESVSASFRKLKQAGAGLTAGRVTKVVKDALRETFGVFEAYL